MKDLKIIEKFPSDFVFGVAASSYQIEGNSYGGSGSCHWDDFAKTSGCVNNNENGSIACAHYLKYKEDIRLIADGGFSAYRFSFSWPRILPDGKGQINGQAISFYDKLIDEMLQKDLKPFGTLYHWDLPSTFGKNGGWKNRDTTKWFADYTDIVMRKFSDRLFSVATINEPWCVAWLSHYLGEHAPGERNAASGVETMHMILVAHAEALQVIRGNNFNNAGIVLNKQYVSPYDETENSLLSTSLSDEIHNLWFDKAIFKGSYPNQTLKLFDKFMPKNYEKDLELISQPIDWVGVNYYTRSIIKPDKTDPFLGFSSTKGNLPTTDMGWEIYPQGLEYLVKRLHENFSQGIPIFITENGMANQDFIENGIINDLSRIQYYSEHLKKVRNLVESNVPVKGYFAWSLMDNFEWAFGYQKRFGLVYVDFDTQTRVPKNSYYAFQEALKLH